MNKKYMLAIAALALAVFLSLYLVNASDDSSADISAMDDSDHAALEKMIEDAVVYVMTGECMDDLEIRITNDKDDDYLDINVTYGGYDKTFVMSRYTAIIPSAAIGYVRTIALDVYDYTVKAMDDFLDDISSYGSEDTTVEGLSSDTIGQVSSEDMVNFVQGASLFYESYDMNSYHGESIIDLSGVISLTMRDGWINRASVTDIGAICNVYGALPMGYANRSVPSSESDTGNVTFSGSKFWGDFTLGEQGNVVGHGGMIDESSSDESSAFTLLGTADFSESILSVQDDPIVDGSTSFEEFGASAIGHSRFLHEYSVAPLFGMGVGTWTFGDVYSEAPDTYDAVSTDISGYIHKYSAAFEKYSAEAEGYIESIAAFLNEPLEITIYGDADVSEALLVTVDYMGDENSFFIHTSITVDHEDLLKDLRKLFILGEELSSYLGGLYGAVKTITVR